MPILRRYCRVSKYTVLECRIYLDDPALLHSWFLNPRHRVLPRIFSAIKPLVLPKLIEERERGKAKSKGGGIKDAVVEDDFEVSIFLTDGGTRHAVLTKQKTFQAKGKLKSNSSKLTGGDVEIRREDESPDEAANRLQDIPLAPKAPATEPAAPVAVAEGNEDGRDETSEPIQLRNTRKRAASQSLFLGSDSSGFEDDDDDDDFEVSQANKSKRKPKKRQRSATSNTKEDPVLIEDGDSSLEGSGDEDEDKDKIEMKTEYEGFGIYGRILYLVVKKRGNGNRKQAGNTVKGPGATAGAGMMEEWIAMSQVVRGDGDGDGGE
ncbi:hypothetical protein RUND412_010266 [Rhizina undulata]